MESVVHVVGSLSQSVLIRYTLPIVHQILLVVGFPEDSLPTPEAWTYTFLVVVVTAFAYKHHSARRKQLNQELLEAQAKLRYLQEKLLTLPKDDTKKEVRIFMDGAFDLLHYGHMNAFRLGRSLGTHLVVGVNSDESISQCKGPPLMNDEERMTMVSACKFVDEILPNCPYIMNREYLDYVIETYKIDYVIHGDDPCIVDGKDVYAAAKEAGKYRGIPRTEGVSTTDIVGRMLLMTKEHHYHNETSSIDERDDEVPKSPGSSREWLGRQSKFLTTSRMLQLFSADVQAPTPHMRVVYIDGAWDLFHPGHVAILRAARERGDYLIVGIHGDATVNRVRGMNLPLMNLHERVLSVLGCRFADDVLIDAPYDVSMEMIASLNISEVVGTNDHDIGEFEMKSQTHRYRHAEQAGLLHMMDIPSKFNMGRIVERIQRNQEAYQAKFERKMAAEREFYEQKRASEYDAAFHEGRVTFVS